MMILIIKMGYANNEGVIFVWNITHIYLNQM